MRWQADEGLTYILSYTFYIYFIWVIAVAAGDAEGDGNGNGEADVIGDTLNDVGLYEEYAELVAVA